jgi:hypothetical protein
MAKSKQAQKSSYSAKSTSKTSGQAKKPVTKKRGALLSVLLGLVLAHGIFATYLAYTNLRADYVDYKSWVLTGLSLVSIATVVAAIGMWLWKQWGIYLYTIASIVAMAIHMMLTGSLMVVFYDLLPVAILSYVISLQSKRELFE